MTDESSRNPVEVLADEYLSRLRAGEGPSIDEFAAAHPEHADALRELLPAMQAMEELKQDRSSRTPPAAALGKPALERLGDFRIVREVGRGGMGIVYEAVQESLGRRVAVKVLPRQMLLDGQTLKRFEREAQTAARLHHTNIVPVFGTGEHDGYHYFAMQFIVGRGLDEVIKSLAAGEAGEADALAPRGTEAADGTPAVRPPSSGLDFWRQTARLGLQAARALHYAHDHGTLHRDIKPSNLRLDEEGVVWVTDFGLAKALEQDGLTHSGDVLGTLQYMAPEQFRGVYDVRSEVYGLGLTLYELATLRSAFRGRTRSELMEKIRNGAPTAPRRIRPEMPRDLETIVLKAIAPDPSDRYQTAGELASDLERFLGDRPIEARRVAAAEHLWRWCRRNRAMAGLAAAAVVALAAAAVVGWIAFGTTRTALRGEQESARQARAATAQAETHLLLALEAFESVFDQVSGADPFQAFEEDPDTEEYLAVVRTSVSDSDAALLQSILTFYDRFAERNAEDARLQQEAAKAHRRVGDIHRRLERPEEAQQSYQRALTMYRSLDDRDYSVEIAAVHNELGQVRLDRRDPVGAADQHRRALEVLTGGGDGSRRARFELARTHNLLGRALDIRSGRGGGRRGGQPRGDPGRSSGRTHHRQAEQIVVELLVEDPDNPELKLLEARCLRRRSFRRVVGEEDAPLDRAVTILEGLVARFPEADPYRFELIETYAMGRGGWMGRGRGAAGPPERGRAASPERMARACEHARKLRDKHPDHRGYGEQLVRVLTLHGAALSRTGNDAEALVPLEQALDLEAELARSTTRSIAPQQWMTRLYLATTLRNVGRPEEARELLEEVLEGWREPRDGRARGRGVPMDRVRELLADLLDDLGETERAAELRRRSASRRRRPR